MPLSLPDLTGIALAFALGLLIGVQRGWATRAGPPGSRFAGVRTFGLLGLAGGLAGALRGHADGFAMVLVVAAAALVVIGYWRATQRNMSISGTGSMVGLLTLACGFIAGGGNLALASVAAGLMVLVLAMRNQLHGWVRALDEREMQAIARFGLIALVVLPLLPDTRFGPYLAWHPRQLWMVVVLVCGFSFLGYLAARKLGASRGVLATSAAGAVVSSTAVTASLAGKLRDGEGDAAVLGAGVALASAVMFARVMALTGALAAPVLPGMALWAVPGMLVSLFGAAWLIRKRPVAAAGERDGPMALRNPFDFGPALLLMLLVMVLTVLARWVEARFGDAGLATVIALSGMMDVDSAIITLGNLPPGTLPVQTAALVLMPPVLLNTAIKAGMAISLAGWRQARASAAILLASLIASLAALPALL